MNELSKVIGRKKDFLAQSLTNQLAWHLAWPFTNPMFVSMPLIRLNPGVLFCCMLQMGSQMSDLCNQGEEKINQQLLSNVYVPWLGFTMKHSLPL